MTATKKKKTMDAADKGLKGGRKMRNVRKLHDANKIYSLVEAIDFMKSNAFAKFDESVEIAMNLGVDPKHSDQMVRGVVSMPNGTGKNVRVAVFARDEKEGEAKKAGADIVGSEELVEKILKGEINFDTCIATPDMMGIVGRVAKVLGPKGLMPNPKLGTVTANVADAIKTAKSGQVEYRVEKEGIIHTAIGKVSFDKKALEENLLALINAVVKARPSGAKGEYVKSISISSTMGVGVRVDTTPFIAKK